uniref:Reverse transcriptase zinc-binding domain-containing protein n=1 Tax=Tanacetum cinerariifolium TaxID=118510 RepID=A0A699J355_TANCI|nr:hypothetical protein [Tanacetum cinerariifolium]
MPSWKWNIYLFLERSLACDRYNAGSWNWQWIRPVACGRTESMLQSLQLVLADVTLSSSPDLGKWHIGYDGSFTVASTHTHVDNLILPSLASSKTWTTCLPRKVNIFLGRFDLDRLPQCLNLSKHGMEIDSILCSICNKNVESVEHIFFSCEVASQIWHMVRIWCNITYLAMPSYTDWRSCVENVSGSSVKKKRLFVIIASMF